MTYGQLFLGLNKLSQIRSEAGTQEVIMAIKITGIVLVGDNLEAV